MNQTRFSKLFYFLLLFVLVACQAQTTATVPIATSLPATATPVLPTATPSSLDLLVGRYGNKFKIDLDLLPDGSFYHEESTWGSYGVYELVQDQISFVEENPNNPCYQHPAGVYKWSLNNGELKLEQVNDDCRQRQGYFGKTFKKMKEQKPFVTVVRLTTVKDLNFVAADQFGNFYVTDGLYNFSKYDSTGKLIQTWGMQNITDTNTFTTGIAVDPQGNIYIGDWLDAEIQKYDAKGNFLTSWKVDSGNIGPVGMGFDAQGNLYVALHRIHDHYVEKYDTQGNLLGAWAPFGTEPGQILAGPRSGPEEIAVDADGNNYVQDPENGRVNKYDATGKFLYSLPVVGSIVVDKQGNVYINSGTLWKYDSAGNLIGEWYTPVFGAMALNKDGNIIVAGNPISKILLPAP